jgi:hypothetical protein
VSAAGHQRRAVRHSYGLHSGSPVAADVGLKIDKLTATGSTISPSTKIIPHDHPPDREHGGPSRTLRMDLRIRIRPAAYSRSFGRILAIQNVSPSQEVVF